jgi:hypothetical protein
MHLSIDDANIAGAFPYLVRIRSQEMPKPRQDGIVHPVICGNLGHFQVIEGLPVLFKILRVKVFNHVLRVLVTPVPPEYPIVLIFLTIFGNR